MVSDLKDLAVDFAVDRDSVKDARAPVTHDVKSWPHLFEATLRGTKTHEMRKIQDRDYRIGDMLNLMEFDPLTGKYSGRNLLVLVTYITSSEYPCALSEASLHPDYCILSIKRLHE